MLRILKKNMSYNFGAENENIMAAWTADDEAINRTENPSTSNDGLLLIFGIILFAIAIPLCAIIFGSQVRRLLRRIDEENERNNSLVTIQV